MELQRSSTPPDQFSRQGEPQTRALHPFAIPFGLKTVQTNAVKALTETPSKTERAWIDCVLAGVELIQGPRVGLNRSMPFSRRLAAIPEAQALTREHAPRLAGGDQANPC